MALLILTFITAAHFRVRTETGANALVLTLAAPVAGLAEAVQQQARGLAMTQASRRKVDDTLKRARELLERGAGDAANPIAAPYDGQLFKLQTAICYAEPGRPDAATEIYGETLKPEVFSARDFAYFSVLKAAGPRVCSVR